MKRIVLLAVLATLPWTALAEQLGEPEPPDPESVMTLRQAIALALRNNLDIEIARADPALAAEGVEAARGAFDPVGSASSSFAHSETPVASTFQAGGSVAFDGWTYDTGVSGILPLGVSYSSGYVMQRSESGSDGVNLAREWSPTWRSEVTLPLLRDFYNNTANVAVRRGRLAYESSEEQFRLTLSDLILGIENSYWGLAASRAQERVAQKSLATARDLLERTRIQVEVGSVAPVAVTEAEAGVAERELNAIIAQNRAAAGQDALINTLLAPRPEVFADMRILTEPPTFRDYPIDVGEAVAKAMKLRPELVQAQKQLEDAQLQLDLAENQRRPRLDVIASYEVQGLSGSPKSCGQTFGCRLQIAQGGPGAPLASDPVGPELGDSLDSHDAFFRADGAHSWSVTGRVEIPFGNTTARARASQRNIELRRARTLLRRQQQSIILDVRNAVRNFRSSVEAVEAAERRRIASEETLRAEQERDRLGTSTPFEVLQREEDLAEAERQVITSLLGHRNAITALEQSQGGLLEARQISIAEELAR